MVKVDGQEVRNRDHLTQIVGGLAAGSTHEFEVIRGGEPLKLSVKIGVRDDKDEVAPSKSLWPGMLVARLTDELRSAAKVAANVDGLLVGAVTDPDTPAAKAGFQAGDVIVSVNGKVREERDGLLPGAERHLEAERDLRGEPGRARR